MEGGKETLAAIFFCVFGFFFLPESAGEPEEKRNGNNSFECLDVGKWEGVGWGAIRQLRETGRRDFRCSHGGFAEAPPAISSRMVACLPLSLRFLQGKVIGQNGQAAGHCWSKPREQEVLLPCLLQLSTSCVVLTSPGCQDLGVFGQTGNRCSELWGDC